MNSFLMNSRTIRSLLNFIVMLGLCAFTQMAVASDYAAELFLDQCARCHTFGEGELEGPDLIESKTLLDEELDEAILLMQDEDNVDPLSEEDVAALKDLIRDDNVLARLDAQKLLSNGDSETGSKDHEEVLADSVKADTADLAAEKYVLKCSGCHTVGHGKLNGPDLIGSEEWPDSDLITKIKLMETKVGPLPDEEVEMYRQFLKSDDVQERIAVEKERASAATLAKLAPPDAKLGEELYLGTRRFENGGIACITCHKAGARGGTMGPDLTDSFTKLGRVALMSSIEAGQYPVMRGAYQNHPVTAQESAHLAEYLSRPDLLPSESKERNVNRAGALLAGILLIGILYAYRRKQFKPSGA